MIDHEKLRKEAESFRRRVVKEIEETGVDWDLASCRVRYADLQGRPESKNDFNPRGTDNWKEYFHPMCFQGHNPGGYYWIMPVQINNKEKIDCFEDVAELDEYEISVPIEYFDQLLLGLFIEAFNPDPGINRHRFSCVEHPEGIYEKGFVWYTHYNFYTYEDIRQLTTRLKETAEALKLHDIKCLGERQTLRLLAGRMLFAETNHVPDGMLDRISDFYIEMSRCLLDMTVRCKVASAIAVELL